MQFDDILNYKTLEYLVEPQSPDIVYISHDLKNIPLPYYWWGYKDI